MARVSKKTVCLGLQLPEQWDTRLRTVYVVSMQGLATYHLGGWSPCVSYRITESHMICWTRDLLMTLGFTRLRQAFAGVSGKPPGPWVLVWRYDDIPAFIAYFLRAISYKCNQGDIDTNNKNRYLNRLPLLLQKSCRTSPES